MDVVLQFIQMVLQGLLRPQQFCNADQRHLY